MSYASDIGRFATGISFRLWPPERPPRGFRGIDHRLHRLGISLEALDTQLPTDAAAIRHRVAPLLSVPRMSTYAIGAILNYAVSRLPDDAAYVNVGVWHGFTFLAGMAGNPGKRVIGIDNFSEHTGSEFGDVRSDLLTRFEEQRGPRHEFHDLDYVEYFRSQHEGPIGLYLYDGEHSYENQLRSLEVAEPFLMPGAAIMIDDIYAEPARRALDDFMAARQERYEIVFDRGTATGGHPTFWNGMVVVERR